MACWEYRYEDAWFNSKLKATYTLGKDRDGKQTPLENSLLDIALQVLGNMGWECYAVVPLVDHVHRLYFKRQIGEKI